MKIFGYFCMVFGLGHLLAEFAGNGSWHGAVASLFGACMIIVSKIQELEALIKRGLKP